MARECGPPSWVLHSGFLLRDIKISSENFSQDFTWVARIRGP